MPKPLSLHPDRLFPANSATRAIARALYEQVAGLPIISPHGHTDPAWFAQNAPFGNPTELLVMPDHYVFRMLYSQGIPMEELGIGRAADPAFDPRAAWPQYCANIVRLKPLPCGHYPAEQVPDQVTTELEAFLGS